MSKTVIWDLDGTLLDSYDVIVDSIFLTFSEYGIRCSKEEIHRYAIAFSIGALFAEHSEKLNMDVQLLNQRYSQISAGKYQDIKIMKHGREVLQALKDRGVENFVYTHRGKTTIPVLENLNLMPFFREIITSQSGFRRKPDPEALNYLIARYDLDLQNTFYVGDRRLDMECARNAGIPGILYMPDKSFDVSGAQTHMVKDLLDILQII